MKNGSVPIPLLPYSILLFSFNKSVPVGDHKILQNLTLNSFISWQTLHLLYILPIIRRKWNPTNVTYQLVCCGNGPSKEILMWHLVTQTTHVLLLLLAASFRRNKRMDGRMMWLCAVLSKGCLQERNCCCQCLAYKGLHCFKTYTYIHATRL